MQHPVELLNTMKTLLNFDEADVARLKTLGPVLIPHAAEMAEKFYATLEQFEECREIIAAHPERREKLRSTLTNWYAEIFSGDYGSEYAERRWIIGLVHVKVWIPPYYVVGAMETVYIFSARKLNEIETTFSGNELFYIESLSKMLRIDLAFIEQSYAQSINKAMALEIGTNEALLHRVVESGATLLLTEMRQKA